MKRASRRAADARGKSSQAKWGPNPLSGFRALERMGLGYYTAPAFLELIERVRRDGLPSTVVAVVKFDGGALVQLAELGALDEVALELGPIDLVECVAQEAHDRAELVGGVGIVYLDLRTNEAVQALVAKPRTAPSCTSPGGAA